MTTFRCIDFETTGFPPGAGVVEIGCCDVIVEPNSDPVIGEPWATLVNPFRASPDLVMHTSAQAVHQITMGDLADAPSVDEGFRRATDGADVFVAHNAAFERQFFGGSGKPWVCTMRAARRAWPDKPSHALQTLRFALDLPIADREYARAAHRAGPDAYVTAFLFVDLLRAGLTPETMIAGSNGPALLPRIPFGKHKGSRFEDLPFDYLKWLRGTTNDADIKHTIAHEMRRRQAAGQGGGSRGLVSTTRPEGGF